MRYKLIRVSTVPLSLSLLLEGQLAFLNQYYDVTGVSSHGEELDLVRGREQIRVEAINMKRNISLYNDLKSLYRLYRFFRKEKPLIVHSITPKAGLLSMMAAGLSGVPIRMHTFTGLVFPYRTGLLQKILIFTDKLLCRCATNIYPEGEGVKKDLLKYKITSKPLNILANGSVNGIDSSFFNPALFSSEDRKRLRTCLSLKASDFVFIYVGRLSSDKGINELVKAFTEINNTYTYTRLLLVGAMEPELDPLTTDTIDVINKHEHIISTGWQTDVRPYYAISDALVFPSFREGFPNVVMQAGAMNIPSIVTDISGCNEIIIEGENGTFVPSRDYKSLRDKMEQFITCEKLLLKLKSKTKDMIKTRYEQDVVWRALLDEYRKLEKTSAGQEYK